MTATAIDGLKSDNDLWNATKWQEVNQVVDCLQRRIVKAVKKTTITAGCLTVFFRMLEPCEVKVSRRVLRGRWGRKVPSLPDMALLSGDKTFRRWEPSTTRTFLVRMAAKFTTGSRQWKLVVLECMLYSQQWDAWVGVGEP